MIGKRLMNESEERNIPLTLWSGRWGCPISFSSGWKNFSFVLLVQFTPDISIWVL